LSNIFNGPTQVAHAGGLWKSMLYTNSEEAILKNYVDGFRFFEIDLAGLADGHVITAHDGSEARFGVTGGKKFGEVSLSDVSLTCLKTRLTILRLERLLEIARDLQMRLILDVKNNHELVYSKIYNVAKSLDALHLVIPQAYNERTVENVKNLGFPHWLMTFWGIGRRSPEEKVQFCEIHRPSIVWMRADTWSPNFEAQVRNTGVQDVGLHANMDAVRSREFLRRGLHVMNDCTYIDAYDEDVDAALISEQINALYRLYLKRKPDTDGLNKKLDRVVAGKSTINDVRVEIINSAEHKALIRKPAAK
jgi:hypothetical protein